MLDQPPALSRHKVIPAPDQIVVLIHDGIPHCDAAHSCLVVSAVAAWKALGSRLSDIPKAPFCSGKVRALHRKRPHGNGKEAALLKTRRSPKA